MVIVGIRDEIYHSQDSGEPKQINYLWPIKSICRGVWINKTFPAVNARFCLPLTMLCYLTRHIPIYVSGLKAGPEIRDKGHVTWGFHHYEDLGGLHHPQSVALLLGAQYVAGLLGQDAYGNIL